MKKFQIFERKITIGNPKVNLQIKEKSERHQRNETKSCRDLNHLSFLEIVDSNFKSKEEVTEKNLEPAVIKLVQSEVTPQRKECWARSISTKNMFLDEKSLIPCKRRNDIRTLSLSLANGKSLLKPFASIVHRNTSSLEISPHKAANKDSYKASKKELFFDLVSNSIKSLSQKKTHFLNFGVKKTLIEEMKKPSELLRRKSMSVGKLKAREALIATDNFMDSIKNLISNLSQQKEEAQNIYKRDFNVSHFNNFSLLENDFLLKAIPGLLKVSQI